ncbi:MAG: putative sulfate/molybdate transporter [Elusimicrobiota bacterium]
MRFDLGELSGSLGDLGTFIPLAVSMISVCGLDAGTVLVFAGLFNVLTGIAFNQPVPVQPMKAIAAVAIAEQLAPGEIAAAGFVSGAVVLVLGLSGLVCWAERIIPRPVVRGIQLGVGLKLAAKGIGMVLGLDWLSLDGRLVAAVAGGIVLATSQRKRFPAALVIFVAGLVIFLIGRTDVLHGLSWGWDGPRLVLPDLAQWKTGILQGALPQVPLTLLNSVIAVCALSSDLYPGKGIGTRPMAVSVGLMNVGACLFGAMPACHGSGGLAGQHRFGARTGGSVVMLGIGKILIGTAFGGAAMIVLAAYPASILGILLVFAGLELTLPARDCVERNAFFVAAATAGGILAFNTWLGFILGLFAAAFVLRGSKDSIASE